MRRLLVVLGGVLVAVACRAEVACPAEPLKIAFVDRAAGAFLRGHGPDFDPADPGIIVQEVRTAVKALGCPAHLIRLPHKRLMSQLDAGEIDFAVGYADTPERLLRWRFPTTPQGVADKAQAVGESPIHWVVLADRQPELQAQWREGQLRGRLGSVQDTLSSQLAAERGFKTLPVVSLNDVPKLLSLRRFEAIAMPTMAYTEPFSQSPQPLASLDPPLGRLVYYTPSSRTLFERSPGLVRAFWQALCDEARRRPVAPGCRR